MLRTSRSRAPFVLRAVLAGALLLSAVLALPMTAHAVSTGSGGWYWPVGTENFHGWDGWWAYRPQHPVRWHEAQDMPVAVGHAVYAIGSGTILEAGGDHGYGGVIVVLHKTGEGQYFKAVYGHMHPCAGIKKGGTVKAGQVVGHVNGAAHLHFGIHPGKAYPPDNNPYRGHTYDSSKTYGWVDPVKYLRTHPRILKYKAPALPVVATVRTTDEPTVLGTADGSVFWTTGEDEAATLFSRAILDEDAPVTELEEAPEGLDTQRYRAKESTSSFTLSDKLPVLTLSPSGVAPTWGHSVKLAGKLASASDAVFIGARVIVESSADGTTWDRIGAALSGLKGAFCLAYVPARRVGLRARFVAPDTYLPAVSAVATVAPRPTLSAPVTTKATTDRPAKWTGTLAPRHATGTGIVMIEVQRLDAGAWTAYSTVSAVCADCGSTSRYSRSLTLPRGSWRLRASTAADSRHSAGVSAWTSLSLR